MRALINVGQSFFSFPFLLASVHEEASGSFGKAGNICSRLFIFPATILFQMIMRVVHLEDLAFYDCPRSRFWVRGQGTWAASPQGEENGRIHGLREVDIALSG